MNYGTTNAVAATVKKVYYVLRNKSFGFLFIPKAQNLNLGPVLGGMPRDHSTFVGKNLAGATQYNSIDALLTAYGMHGVYNGTYSSNLEIVRIEETPGVATRREVKCGETPTGFIVRDGAYSFLQNPESPLCNGWVSTIDQAKSFASAADASYALTLRASRLGTAYRAVVVGVIDGPATPIITETTLS